MRVNTGNLKSLPSSWATLYRVAGTAAIVMAVLIPVQSFLFIAYPPPSTVVDYFALFQRSPFVGLLNLDLLLVLDNILMVLIYLGLYMALRRINPSLITIGLTLSLVGIAAYLASNTGFEMLSLSHRYAAATTEAQRASLLAAGQGMLAIYSGTGFAAYYVLNAVALLLFSWVMLRSSVFSKANAYLGLAAGFLMSIPSTAGLIGVLFAMLSLVPWFAWLMLFSRQIFRLAQADEFRARSMEAKPLGAAEMAP